MESNANQLRKAALALAAIPGEGSPEGPRRRGRRSWSGDHGLARAALALNAVAALAALASVAVGVVLPGTAAVYLLAFSTLLLGGGAFAQGRAGSAGVAAAETDDARFRRDLINHAVGAVLITVFALLSLVELIALLTGLGAFLLFGAVAVGFVTYYSAILGVHTLLLCAAVLLRARFAPSTPPRHGDVRARVLLGVTIVAVVVALAINAGLAYDAGLSQVAPERAPFILALGLLTLNAFVRQWTRFPGLRDVGAWIEEEERFRQGGAPTVAVHTLAALTMALLGATAVAHYALASPGMALVLAGVSALFLVATPVGVGLTRVVEELEEGRSDFETQRHRRKLVLLTSTSVLALLGAGGAAAALAGLVAGAGFVAAHFPAILIILGTPSVAAAIARTQVPAEDEYTETRKALGAYMGAALLGLAFFGLFLASGIASGALVGFKNGVALVLLAHAVAVFHVRNRLLLPGLIGLARKALADGDEDEAADQAELEDRARRSMITTYLVAMGLMLLGVGGIALTTFGVVPSPSGSQGQGLLAVWGVAVVVALAVAVYRHVQKANVDTTVEAQEQEIGKRRLSNEELNRYLIIGFSVSAAAILAIMGVLVNMRIVTSLGGVEIAKKYATDFYVFALLIGLGPYGFYANRQESRIQAIDEKFPEFLRDLAESKRAGMTLTEAVITASKGTYGALTADIRKMAAQIEWGVSFTEALERFSKRVQTPLIERTVALIVRASNAGGNVIDVLTAAADDSREIQQIIRERRASMSIYVAIIYVAFFVFIGVIAVLNAQFIPEIGNAVTEAAESGAPNIGGLKFAPVDQQAFKTIFFHAAIIQALGGGLVAGVMGQGKPVMGLKHAFTMIIIGYVAFRFVVGA